MNRWRASVVTVATEAEKHGKPVINGGNLLGRQFAERPAYPPFVDGSKLIDQREDFPKTVEFSPLAPVDFLSHHLGNELATICFS